LGARVRSYVLLMRVEGIGIEEAGPARILAGVGVGGYHILQRPLQRKEIRVMVRAPVLVLVLGAASFHDCSDARRRRESVRPPGARPRCTDSGVSSMCVCVFVCAWTRVRAPVRVRTRVCACCMCHTPDKREAAGRGVRRRPCRASTCVYCSSWGMRKRSASPSDVMRAVRPHRCTYSSTSVGGSY